MMLNAIRLALACSAATLWFASLSASAAGGAADEVSLNFTNADINAVVQAVGKITKRNFIVDPRVKGTFNLVTNRPIAPGHAYQLLLAALRLQGYTAVESNGVVIVLPEVDAKLHSVPVSSGKSDIRGDSPITQIFALRHESAAQLLPIVRPLVSPNNTVAAYPNNNTLVITDYAENVDRIGRIIEVIDQPHGDVETIPLKHASALDLAPTISRLLGEGSTDASQRVIAVADTRVNALLIRTDNPSRLAAVRKMVATLDRESIAGNIHLIYMKNAEASKVAQVLRSVLSGDTAGSSAGTSTAQGSAGSSAPGAGAAVAQPASSSAGIAASGMIQADPVSNALIINAPEAIYNNLRQIVDGLDRRRAQVQVEALIAEISADRVAEFGIQWQGGNSSGSGASGGTNFSSGGSNIVKLSSDASSVTNGFNLAIGKGTSLHLLARALETQSGTNILSTPNIITLDNEEAKIVVGENVPFVTGQYTTSGSTSSSSVNPFQTISRQDVGLTLRIKSQISEGGTVRMQIYQESSSVDSSTINNSSGPTTKKRSIETSALVDDGAIIALGGLVKDSYVSTSEKVPVVGDIPIVGNLFRYDTRNRTKTNLVVFLRPKILREANSYQSLTADRYEQVIGQQRQHNSGERMLLNEPPPPELPPRAASSTAVAPAAGAK